MTSLSPSSSVSCRRWTLLLLTDDTYAIMDSTSSVPELISISETLARLASMSDLEAIDECVNMVTSGQLEDQDTARAIIEAGLGRGEAEARKVEAKIASSSTKEDKSDFAWATCSDEELNSAISQAVGDDDSLRQLVLTYGTLFQARGKLETYIFLSPKVPAPTATSMEKVGDVANLLQGNEDQVDLDDPWADDEGAGTGQTDSTVIDDPWETNSAKSSKTSISASAAQTRPRDEQSDIDEPTEPPMPLADFLAHPIIDSALLFASSAATHGLRILVDRHTAILMPYRFAILESMPSWVSPAELKEHGLLPALEGDGSERHWLDEKATVAFGLYDRYPTPRPASSHLQTATQPRSAEELSQWFTARVDDLDELGMLDLQLAWVQHGASIGIPKLDALGEDLSLLSRLIYDSNLTPDQHDRWTLSTWRAAGDNEVVGAYLSNSTPVSIVGHIRRLVLPYLYVLESRAEREGRPDTHLVERLLHEAVLSLSLQKALPVFEASKATMPMSERLIRNDQNVARLALACLYGSDEREVWSTMSSIFECLPVWDVSGGDLESDKEATSTTLESIATFVRPTTSSAKPPSAEDLFIFFSPLPFASLSRALDILDVHLESGEILARWGTAVQLRFLLQSSRDKEEQTQLAEKMVRRQSVSLSADRWPKLWEDMCRLSGGDDALLRGAFGMLSTDDMMRVYLSGLLSSGSRSSSVSAAIMSELTEIRI